LAPGPWQHYSYWWNSSTSCDNIEASALFAHCSESGIGIEQVTPAIEDGHEPSFVNIHAIFNHMDSTLSDVVDSGHE
jgi:hypothetical protein